MSGVGFAIEGIRVNCLSMGATAGKIIADCKGSMSFGVYTMNLDHVVKLRRNRAFKSAYATARYVTADGFPIVWAGRLRGMSAERVAGSDLIDPICEAAAREGLPIYLFGSSFDALSRCARQLTARYPSLQIAGAASPEADFDPASPKAADYARLIAESGARICFVALGAPKQEIFTAGALVNSPGLAFVCIGAGLDFIAGVQKRAPQWARTAGVEWLWRLLSNPARLARRYLDCLLVLPVVLLGSRADDAPTAEASP